MDALKEMTKTERRQFYYAVDSLRMIEHDIHHFLATAKGVPEDWHRIAKPADHRDTARSRCTLSLDADVVKFFKAMGPGYQPRINWVLRAFMHLRLAKIVEGPDVNDYVLRPESVAFKHGQGRPEWGDAAELLSREE